MMIQKYKFPLLILLSVGLPILIIVWLYKSDAAVLNPKGWVAIQMHGLIVLSIALMFIVVIPVFIMLFAFVWKFREDKKARYEPEWDNNNLIEAIWWGVPCLIIAVLTVYVWKSSHELDPFKPLDIDKPPVKIQVVALQWKWLFIYPEHGIAAVNFLQFPEKTPVNFEITSDAPMNGFWIPQLAGQIYAMPGMNSKLHLIADEMGSYAGSSTNISGTGFSGMRFVAKASSEVEFEEWVQEVKQSSNALTFDDYRKLVKPSEYDPVSYYIVPEEDLYSKILTHTTTPQLEE